MTYDEQAIKEIVDQVFDDYIYRRLEELLSTQRGNSRLTTEEIQGTLGKAQAAKELQAQLLSKF